jgi:hypothetical protein
VERPRPFSQSRITSVFKLRQESGRPALDGGWSRKQLLGHPIDSASNLAPVVRHLPAAKMDIVCRIGSNPPVSLRYLVEDYAQHLVHHFDQVGVGALS